MKCSGNPLETCGGPNSNSIYRTNISIIHPWWCDAASKKCQFDIDNDCCNSMWKSPQDACDNFNFNNQCGSQIKSK